MKLVSVIAAVAIAVLAGCGSDGPTESTISTSKPKGNDSPEARMILSPPPSVPPERAPSRRWATLERAAGNKARLLLLPSGRPPENVIVRDLERGAGEVLAAKDWITVRYIALDYRTGRRFEDRWDQASRWIFGTGEINEGWEIGLRGMRVGGLRELLVPSYLAYEQQGDLVYLVKLLKAERPDL